MRSGGLETFICQIEQPHPVELEGHELARMQSSRCSLVMPEGGPNAETKIGKGEASEGTGAAQDWTPAPGPGNPEQEEESKN